jgi:outer membrane biosynthesis protein TonB
MDKNSKNKRWSIIAVIAILIIAGISIFTAVRLYQLRQKPVAPNVPESKPEAATSGVFSCQQLVFTIQTPTPTPTRTPTPTPTRTPTPTPTRTPTPTPTRTPTPTPPGSTATPTPPGSTATPTPTNTANVTSTPTNQPTNPVTAQAETPEPGLPDAGFSTPTILAISIAIILIISSIAIIF